MMPTRRLGERAGHVGQAAIAIGIGRGPAAPDHLGPHNALEWVIYLGHFAVIAAVVINEWRSLHALPDLPEPGQDKTGRPHAPTNRSPDTRSDQSFDEPAPPHDES
jgi:hypothetical protein